MFGQDSQCGQYTQFGQVTPSHAKKRVIFLMHHAPTGETDIWTRSGSGDLPCSTHTRWGEDRRRPRLVHVQPCSASGVRTYSSTWHPIGRQMYRRGVVEYEGGHTLAQARTHRQAAKRLRPVPTRASRRVVREQRPLLTH